jgi:hypothetical protein
MEKHGYGIGCLLIGLNSDIAKKSGPMAVAGTSGIICASITAAIILSISHAGLIKGWALPLFSPPVVLGFYFGFMNGWRAWMSTFGPK